DSSTAESSSTERTWHLAAAAQGEDERIASSLETVALDARGRGAQAVASKAFEHAARLSPEVEARARRLHEAGADAYLAGEAERSRDLLQEAATSTSEPALFADIRSEERRVGKECRATESVKSVVKK